MPEVKDDLMNNTLLLAGIIGPILIVLSLSEYLNYKIWKDVAPTVVYLNGLILFAGGLIIIRIHNAWIAGWPVLITVVGWLCLLGGGIRMFLPSQKQVPLNKLSTLMLLVLFLLGVFLSIKAYFLFE